MLKAAFTLLISDLALIKYDPLTQNRTRLAAICQVTNVEASQPRVVSCVATYDDILLEIDFSFHAITPL